MPDAIEPWERPWRPDVPTYHNAEREAEPPELAVPKMPWEQREQRA
jgi:hypothetical protein